jgi:hypothetical protein
VVHFNTGRKPDEYRTNLIFPKRKKSITPNIRRAAFLSAGKKEVKAPLLHGDHKEACGTTALFTTRMQKP